MKKLIIATIFLFTFIIACSQTTSKTSEPQVKNKKGTLQPVELVFILDRSGSMSGFESDTIGGYNSVLEEQSKVGKPTVTTILFDNNYDVLFDRVQVKDARLDNNNYKVGGSTAMLDAIGKTINDLKAKRSKEDKSKVVFVIVTDGQENASREYTYESVSKLIEEQQKDGWVFMFLGANIDAAKEASKLKIPSNQAAKYHQSGAGNAKMYDSINENISNIQMGKSIDFGDLEDVE